MEMLLRLLAGWWFFLAHHVTRIHPDPDLWIPALAALVVCTLVFFQAARRLHIRHPFSAALSLVLLLPILFATAFLVPGIILQIQLLVEGR